MSLLRRFGPLLFCSMAIAPHARAAEDTPPGAPGPPVQEPGPVPLGAEGKASDGPLSASSREVPASEAAPAAPPRATAGSLPELERLELQLPGVADYNAPDPGRDWRSVGRALASVGVANYLVWQYDWAVGEEWAYTSREELRANFEGGFSFDGNKLPTNFLSHPYQGASYFNVARASGLGFWESTPFVFLGSASWELLGETEAPSTNDLLATTMGGIVLGEVLFRLSSDILDDSSVGFERFLRELFAAVVNPARGIERVADGSAWASGPAPARRHLRHLALEIGSDRILLLQDRSLDRYDPKPLVALQLEYGDLTPTESRQTLEPFESFDLYAALNLGTRTAELGAQIYAQGLLFGLSDDFGNELRAEYRDNQILGIVQSFDFRGAHMAQFGGMGVGPTHIVALRFGKDRRLRIGTDIQWLVIGGSSSPAEGAGPRGYNYLTGVTAGEELRVEMGPYGEFGFRAKQYAAVVIDGEPGEEFIGHTRAWYEIDVYDGIGLGIAPNLVHRISHYDSIGELTLAQLEMQTYARGHF